jgi:hypothetical protein
MLKTILVIWIDSNNLLKIQKLELRADYLLTFWQKSRLRLNLCCDAHTWISFIVTVKIQYCLVFFLDAGLIDEEN